MKLSTERLLLDWRKSFEARDYLQAASVYRAMAASNVDKRSDPALLQIRTEYRKIVATKIETWNQSCSTRTPAGLNALKQQTAELLPDPTIAADMFSKLVPCVPDPPPAAAADPVSLPPVPQPQGCLQMDSTLAMVRIKTRVNPDIPPNRLPVGGAAIELRVKVKIDENGDVTVLGVEGANSYINGMMKDAVAKWKFTPAIMDDRRRCVETELPVRVSRS
jgi:hypothetical protein